MPRVRVARVGTKVVYIVGINHQGAANSHLAAPAKVLLNVTATGMIVYAATGHCTRLTRALISNFLEREFARF